VSNDGAVCLLYLSDIALWRTISTCFLLTALQVVEVSCSRLSMAVGCGQGCPCVPYSPLVGGH
jgi:hypothetical protein